MELVTSIRKLLPYGAIAKVASKTGKSVSTVNRVIDGKSNNPDVLRELRKEIDAEKRRRKKAEKLRQALTQ